MHEAALCGCALFLRQTIGAAADLGNDANSVQFVGQSPDEMAAKLKELLSWDEERFKSASASSRIAAGEFGPKVWARSFGEIVSRIENEC